MSDSIELALRLRELVLGPDGTFPEIAEQERILADVKARIASGVTDDAQARETYELLNRARTLNVQLTGRANRALAKL